ncbi:MAG: hypothetical protein AMXMBFR33_69400 [Candidatus Xenobia bacterium]
MATERSSWSIRPRLLVQFVLATLLFALAYANFLAIFSEVAQRNGLAHANARHYDKAEQAYRQALLLDPLWGENYRHLALLLLSQLTPESPAELRQQVLDLSQVAVRLDGHRPVTQSLLGQVKAELGDLQGARQAYLRALELDPVNYPAFYMELANLEARSGNSQRAGELLELARQRFPIDSLDKMLDFRAEAIREPLSMIYAASGARENPALHPAAAEPYFKTALFLYKNNADALFGLGVAQLSQGRVKEAIASLEKVDKLVPDFVPCLSYLQQAYLADGQRDRAAAVGARLEKLQP